jgi:hypothetical protein
MISASVKERVAMSPYGVARRGLIAAREAVVAAGTEKTHAAVRAQLAEVAVVAAKIRRQEAWAHEFDLFARLWRIAEIRSSGSPHLRVLRALGVDATAPSLKRYANVIEMCLRKGWSFAEIRQRITEDGPDAILRAYPYVPRPRLKLRGRAVH